MCVCVCVCVCVYSIHVNDDVVSCGRNKLCLTSKLSKLKVGTPKKGKGCLGGENRI